MYIMQQQADTSSTYLTYSDRDAHSYNLYALCPQSILCTHTPGTCIRNGVVLLQF